MKAVKTERIVQYLKELVEIPSPSGMTDEVMEYIERRVAEMGYQSRRTNKGNVVITVEGREQSRHRVVTAHVDTLGAIVKAVKADGRLKLDKIGGYPWNMVEGENCLIHPAGGGEAISGTILLHQTSCHVYREAGTLERSQDNIEVRLDERVTSADETAACGIAVGDFVSFAPRFTVTPTGFVKSRFLDDKASMAILLDVLQSLKEENIALPCTTHFMASCLEEVGMGANSSLPAEITEYLSVDMGAIGDDQQTDEYTVSICAKDSSGPYHYGLRRHLTALAKDNEIPYRVDLYPYYGSDASGAMRAGAEAKHGLIGAGIESSHSYERTHIDSLNAARNLVEAYLRSELL